MVYTSALPRVLDAVSGMSLFGMKPGSQHNLRPVSHDLNVHIDVSLMGDIKNKVKMSPLSDTAAWFV